MQFIKLYKWFPSFFIGTWVLVVWCVHHCFFSSKTATQTCHKLSIGRVDSKNLFDEMSRIFNAIYTQKPAWRLRHYPVVHEARYDINSHGPLHLEPILKEVGQAHDHHLSHGERVGQYIARGHSMLGSYELEQKHKTDRVHGLRHALYEATYREDDELCFHAEHGHMH